MYKKNKGQIIIITTISLIIMLVVVYISFLPITKLLTSIRETTDYYQAINITNSGLEIAYLTITFNGFDLLANTTSRGTDGSCYSSDRTSVCGFDQYQGRNQLNRTSKFCHLSRVFSGSGLSGYLNLRLATTNNATTIGGTTFVKTSINSQGVVRNKLANLKTFNWPVVCR